MKLIEKNQADTQTNAACEAEKFPNPVDDIVPGWSIDPVTGERFFTSPKGTTFFAGSGGLRAAVGDRAPAPVCGWIEVVSEGCNRDGKGFKRLVRFKDRPRIGAASCIGSCLTYRTLAAIPERSASAF